MFYSGVKIMEKYPFFQIFNEYFSNFSIFFLLTMDNYLVINLFSILANRKISVPEFSKATGIPKDRVYKWKQQGTSPKAADEKLIIEWIKKMENVPHERNGKPKNEVNPVEFDGFMEVPYLPIHAQAGYLNDISNHHLKEEELPTLLVPKEFEKGKYIVIEVNGDSMDDGSKKSICEGDKLLIKELDCSLWNTKLNYRRYIFAIVHRDGVVVKEITAHNPESGRITCHSWNPIYTDFELDLSDVYQLYYVKKIVDRKPIF